MTTQRRENISKAKRGRPLSAEHRAALLCPDGCACAKHGLRNSGQFEPGSTGFAGPHTESAKELLRIAATRHGMTGTPTHRSFISMWNRCTYPGNASYPNYGGRGIKVCERWRSFENFLVDMGERPEGTTIDRIDNNGNYEPGNCRWATKVEQERNKSNPWLDPVKAERIRAGYQRWLRRRATTIATKRH